jgi:hypothetical protein
VRRAAAIKDHLRTVIGEPHQLRRIFDLLTLSLCTCCPCVHAVATTPAQRLGVLLRSLRPAVSAFPDMAVGSACVLFEVCSAFTALRPAHSSCHQFVTRYVNLDGPLPRQGQGGSQCRRRRAIQYISSQSSGHQSIEEARAALIAKRIESCRRSLMGGLAYEPPHVGREVVDCVGLTACALGARYTFPELVWWVRVAHCA